MIKPQILFFITMLYYRTAGMDPITGENPFTCESHCIAMASNFAVIFSLVVVSDTAWFIMN